MRTKKSFHEVFSEMDGVVLVNRPESVTYLTGFYTTARRPGQIGLTCGLMWGDNIWLFCPQNWKTAAERQLAGDTVEVIGYQGGKENLAKLILKVLRDMNISEQTLQMGIEPEFMDYELSQALRKEKADIDFVSVSQDLNYAKAIKSPEEIEALRKSAALAREAMEYAKTIVRPGIREYEMAAEIEHYMRYRGSDGTPFTMKALSGENSAVTINIPGERKVCQGDIVLFDFGATIDQYISDWTRTFCCGKANEEQKELYRLVWEMERTCIEMMKPGVIISDMMERAMKMAAEHPLGKWFNPYLGHSIGLASSEWPLMNPGVDVALEPGMVLTIEPGVYIPGIGGVRIEDEVLVTETGHEVWTGLKNEVFEVFH